MRSVAEESKGVLDVMGLERKGSVLITGASTGIGAVCALRLTGLGYRVFAGVRKVSDGVALQSRATGTMCPVVIDVTDGGTITAACSEIREVVGEEGLVGLVNNAGIVVAGPLEILPVDALRQQLEVNVLGQVGVTQAFLPLLRHGRGRVVFMASIAGRVVMPFTGAYGASKHALEAVADAFRVELGPWGIWVSVVEPGLVETPIWEKSKAHAESLAADYPAECWELYGTRLQAFRDAMGGRVGRATSPEKVADAVVHALCAGRPKTRYLVGGDARLLALVARFVPDRIRDWLLVRKLGIK